MLIDYSEGAVTSLRELYAAENLKTAHPFADEAVYVRTRHRPVSEIRKAVEAALVEDDAATRSERYIRGFKAKFKDWLATPWTEKQAKDLYNGLKLEVEWSAGAKPRPSGAWIDPGSHRSPAHEVLLRLTPELLPRLGKVSPGTVVTVGSSQIGPLEVFPSLKWAEALLAFDRAQAQTFQLGRIAQAGKSPPGQSYTDLPVDRAHGALVSLYERSGTVYVNALVFDRSGQILGLARTLFGGESARLDLPESTSKVSGDTTRVARLYSASESHNGRSIYSGKRAYEVYSRSNTKRLSDPDVAFALRRFHPIKSLIGDPVAAMIPEEDLICLLDTQKVGQLQYWLSRATNLNGVRLGLEKGGYQRTKHDGWTLVKGDRTGMGFVSLPAMESTLAEMQKSSWLPFERRFEYLKTRKDPRWSVDWDLKWMRLVNPSARWGFGSITPAYLLGNPSFRDGDIKLSAESWAEEWRNSVNLYVPPTTYEGKPQFLASDFFSLRLINGQRVFSQTTSYLPGYLAENEFGDRFWVTADEVGSRAGCAAINPQPATQSLVWAPWTKLWNARLIVRKVEMAWKNENSSMGGPTTVTDGEVLSSEPLRLEKGFPSEISEANHADYQRAKDAAWERYKNGWN